MSKKIAFCSMMAALGILTFVVSVIFTSNTVFLYLMSTLFTYVCTAEYGKKYGFLTYAVISIAAFMICANKVSVLAYAIVVGYYPIVKQYVEHMNINKTVKYAIKIIFAVVISLVAYYLLKGFVVLEFNLALIFAVGIIIFVVYDYVLTMGIKFYALKIRKFIKK